MLPGQSAMLLPSVPLNVCSCELFAAFPILEGEYWSTILALAHLNWSMSNFIADCLPGPRRTITTSVSPRPSWISNPNAVAVASNRLAASTIRDMRISGLSSDSGITKSSMKGRAPTGMCWGVFFGRE